MSKKNTTKNKEFNVEKALIALENAKPKKRENTVFNFLKDNISIIDKKQKEGLSLKDIYRVINSATPLNVSQPTFSKYISVIRKEVGSDLYSPRKTQGLPAESQAQTPSESSLNNCPKCNGNLMKRRYGEQPIFLCNSCNSVFENNDESIGKFLFVNK